MSVKFSVNQLISEEANLEFSSFNTLKNEVKKTNSMDDFSGYITAIKKIAVSRKENRFICIYILNGNRFPYSETVVDERLNEEQNPRKPNLIEMKKQLFALIDCNHHKLYISQQNKSSIVQKWISSKTGNSYIIKSIINEYEFINKVKEISEITFAVEPSLLTSINTLSDHLTHDILGFEADEAKLTLSYSKTKLSNNLKARIRSIFGQKESFKNLVVIGRNEDNSESILNLEGVINKINVEVEESTTTQLYDEKEVFESLIKMIKQNEK